jgi:hypothetical protein
MQTKNPAQRRYLWRFFPAMTAYVIVLFGCTWAIREWEPQGALLLTLAVAPALPIVAVIAIMGLYLAEERDEFIRARLLISMIGGIGVTLTVMTVWGFLENGADVGHFPTFLAFPLWCGSFGVVQCIMSLRDRVTGEGA